MKDLSSFYLLASLAATVIALGGCSRLPNQEVNLAGTSWLVVSIDGHPLDSRSTLVVTFLDLDHATVSSECNAVTTELIVDTDGSGLGFVDPVWRAKPCTDVDEGEDRSQVNAVLDTDAWSVVDQGTIELSGAHRLRMVRATVTNPPATTARRALLV
jgi:hypothetical protein